MNIEKQYQDLEVKKYMLRAKEKVLLYSGVIFLCVGTGTIIINGISIFPIILFGSTVFTISSTKKISCELEKVKNIQRYLNIKRIDLYEEDIEKKNDLYYTKNITAKQKEKRLIKEKRL